MDLNRGGSGSTTRKWTSGQGQGKEPTPASGLWGGGSQPTVAKAPPGPVKGTVGWSCPGLSPTGTGGWQQEEAELSSFIFEMTLLAGGADCLKF